jgi:hypothetical protein
VKKDVDVRPGHPPDAGELVRCTWIYKNYWMRSLMPVWPRRSWSRAMAGRQPAVWYGLKDTAYELVPRVNGAQWTGRLFLQKNCRVLLALWHPVLVTDAISPLELHVNQRRRAITIHSLHAKASGPKEFFVIDGATHLDLYDGEGVESRDE